MTNMIRPDKVFIKSCPSRQVLNLIANKWAVMIISGLSDSTRRYSELQRQIEGITQKMLTQTLRQLEQDGIVNRHVYPVIPPKVEYSLTLLGKTLVEPITALYTWAEEHMIEVEDARKNYQNTQTNT